MQLAAYGRAPARIEPRYRGMETVIELVCCLVCDEQSILGSADVVAAAEIIAFADAHCEHDTFQIVLRSVDDDLPATRRDHGAVRSSARVACRRLPQRRNRPCDDAGTSEAE